MSTLLTSLCGTGGSGLATPSFNPTFFWVGNGLASAGENDQITSPSACNLTKTGTIGSVSGPNSVGTARQNASSGTSNLTQATPPAKMNAGSLSWTWWGWINISAVGSGTNAWSWGTGAASGWILTFNSSFVTKGQLFVSSNVNFSTPTITLTVSTWQFVIVVYNSVASTFGISLNGGALSTTGSVSAMANPSVLTTLGSSATTTYALADWGGVNGTAASANDRAALYSSGNGLTYRNATGWGARAA